MKQYIIEAPGFAKWTTVSGKPNGRSGGKPSLIIASEPHEWSAPTAEAFEMLTANLFKRRQPLLLIDTNAGKSKYSYAWKLHEKAAGVLAGTIEDKALLPFIFEAPRELDWRSEEAARCANPSMPDVVPFERIKPKQNDGESEYRRLYLGQWTTSSDKWLNLDLWDACAAAIAPEAIATLPRYVGLDLSGGDDLCALVNVYPGETYQVTSQFCVPRVTAEKYRDKFRHDYFQWADEGAIELLPEKTVSIAVQQRIAQSIIDSHKVHPITALCYDRAYSSGVIPLLELAGIKCVKIGQGWGVSERKPRCRSSLKCAVSVASKLLVVPVVPTVQL